MNVWDSSAVDHLAHERSLTFIGRQTVDFALAYAELQINSGHFKSIQEVVVPLAQLRAKDPPGSYSSELTYYHKCVQELPSWLD